MNEQRVDMTKLQVTTEGIAIERMFDLADTSLRIAITKIEEATKAIEADRKQIAEYIQITHRLSQQVSQLLDETKKREQWLTQANFEKRLQNIEVVLKFVVASLDLLTKRMPDLFDVD